MKAENTSGIVRLQGNFKKVKAESVSGEIYLEAAVAPQKFDGCSVSGEIILSLGGDAGIYCRCRYRKRALLSAIIRRSPKRVIKSTVMVPANMILRLSVAISILKSRDNGKQKFRQIIKQKGPAFISFDMEAGLLTKITLLCFLFGVFGKFPMQHTFCSRKQSVKILIPAIGCQIDEVGNDQADTRFENESSEAIHRQQGT